MSSPTTHSFLSPSTSHRWLECTPSAMLESAKPSKSSPYAQEGTDAHALAELKLSYALGYISEEEYTRNFEEFKSTSEFYNEEFNEYVDKYVDEVMTIVKFDYEKENIKVYLEERVTFEDIVPGGSGTSDVVIVGPTFIHVIDLKFGKGVLVSAIGNPQLRLYALGAIRKHISECVCSEVRMTIIQPRLNDETTDSLFVSDLNNWAVNYVKPRAALAIKGQGELVPGDHCKFCRCRGECEKLAEKQMSAAQAEFSEITDTTNSLEPCNMTPEMLSRILDIAPKFIDWFKDVKSYAEKAAIVDGVKIPGYKVVEGRSNRILTNPDAIVEILHTSGYADDQILKPREILGITALEKNVGKKRFANLCGEFICKPVGNPTLVPETDRREAMDVRQLRLTGDEFDEVSETDEQ